MRDNRGLIVFSEYILPLNADTQETSTIHMRPRDTTIFQILNPPATALQQNDFLPRMYKSARERVANITTLLIFAFLGFVVATTAGLQRTGMGVRSVTRVSQLSIRSAFLRCPGMARKQSFHYLSGLWFCLYAGVCVWLIFAPGLRLFAWAARRQAQ